MENPRRGYPSSARAERHVHAHSRGAVDNSVRRNHLLSEEIDQQKWRVAFGAVAAQADGSAKEIALRAAALTDETFTATGALIDCVRDDRAALLELLAEPMQVRRGRLLPQAEGALLMSARAIACPR